MADTIPKIFEGQFKTMLSRCKFKLDYHEETSGLSIKLVYGTLEEELIGDTVYLDHGHSQYSESI